MTFKEAARFGDVLEIRTIPKIASNFRLEFDQQVWRVGGSKALVLGSVEMVCVDKQNKMVPLPQIIMKEMNEQYGTLLPSTTTMTKPLTTTLSSGV
jgi:acyl-CoA thioester hydrolase